MDAWVRFRAFLTSGDVPDCIVSIQRELFVGRLSTFRRLSGGFFCISKCLETA
jgi:hypothetical protein